MTLSREKNNKQNIPTVLSDVTAKLQEIDQEDSSLLDGALGEGDVEADESALSILDELTETESK